MGVSLCKLLHDTSTNRQSLPGVARTENRQKNRIDTHQPTCKEAHSYACQKASYTLEAAVILPFIAAFFVFVLFFFRVLQVQTQVQEALYYAGRKTACEAGTVASDSVLLASVEAYFQKEVRQHEQVEDYVAGGSWGISLLRSDLSDAYVDLRADYDVKLPIHFFAVKGIHITQYSKNRKWTGDRDNGALEDYVYVTKTGTVYHCSRACSYLDLSIQAVSYTGVGGLRNKSEHKYYACADCVTNASALSIVYITDYGTCYHANLACSGLKRTISMIPHAEINGRKPCAKCGGHET